MKRPSFDAWVSKSSAFPQNPWVFAINVFCLSILFDLPLLLNKVGATQRSKRLCQFHAAPPMARKTGERLFQQEWHWIAKWRKSNSIEMNGESQFHQFKLMVHLCPFLIGVRFQEKRLHSFLGTICLTNSYSTINTLHENRVHLATPFQSHFELFH